MDELISVIVPVYNVAKYLKRCIESIINQTYSNTEIILVDDGSTDESGDICEMYANNHANIISIHKSNGGLSSARNEGIRKSSGKYICFVDSDDYISPVMIERLYNNIKTFSAEISICDFWWINEGDNPDSHSECKINVVDGKTNILMQIINNYLPTIVAWNKLYKKEIWEGISYPEGRFHEDEFVIHELLNRCERIVYTTEKMYFYIRHNNSITHVFSGKRIIDAVEAYENRFLFSETQNNLLFYEKCGLTFIEVCRSRLRELEESDHENMNERNQLAKTITEKLMRHYKQLVECKALSWWKRGCLWGLVNKPYASIYRNILLSDFWWNMF